jgi:hypothetical protein
MSKTKDSLLSALNVIAALGDPGAEMNSFLSEWASFFETEASIDPDELADLQQTMSDYLSSPNRRDELELVEAAARNPLLGITLVLEALPTIVKREAQRIWELIFAEQSEDGGISAGWNIKEDFPAPRAPIVGDDEDPGVKYLIMSDLHRDAASDDVGILESGSIDHFKANSELYGRIVNFARDEGYILIEGGDCEELWFVRDADDYEKKNGRLDIAKKLEEIIDSHPAIYNTLRELHVAGRYFRIYGNHDSFLKPDGNDDSIAQVLRDFMGPDFEIFDAFVIPGVKGMMEQTAFEILTDTVKLAAGEMPPDDYVANVLRGRLGMDSRDYSADTKMLITHGHQFDFWNCPENQILGMLIANSVGMFVDRNMDPFLDVRGIALQGNPYIDFADAFARWPVFNSWVSHDQSVRFAHEVQHMPNLDRQLTDSVMFCETIAALIGTFGIALNHHPTVTSMGNNSIVVPYPVPFLFFQDSDLHVTTRDPNGVEHGLVLNTDFTVSGAGDPNGGSILTTSPVPTTWAVTVFRTTVTTPQQSKAALCAGQIGLWEYLNRHYIHHICIGHTHNPHSQPYATIQDLGTFAIPLAPVLALIRKFLPLEPTLKTTYFNSGTGGWMEGVIWAIEIDTSGQARLVYWTDNSIGPEYMDWELQPLANDVDRGLKEGFENALGVELTGITTSIEELRDTIEVRLHELAVSAADIGAALGNAAIWPIHTLVAALVPNANQSTERSYQLQEVLPEFISDKLEDLKKQLKSQFDRLRDFGYDALLSAKRRALGCDGSGYPPETLTIKAPISPSEAERIAMYQRVFIEMGEPVDVALHCAGIALSALGRFPVSVPFFSTLLQPLDPMGLLEAVESPVLYGLLSMLWMFPPAGEAAEVNRVRITSNFQVADGEVSLTVTIADAAPVNV